MEFFARILELPALGCPNPSVQRYEEGLPLKAACCFVVMKRCVTGMMMMAGAGWWLQGGMGWAGEIQFNRDVRPILSDKCFHCHGPDAETREAGLRLDTRAGALAGAAVVAGNPEQSEVMLRVLSHEADEQMPPAKSKLDRLSEKEIDVLRQWIAEGVVYEAHWAFVPVAEPVIPSGEGSENPIDALVEAKLREEGLELQPEADKATLIRRVSFDLTGLPPSEEAVKAFLADGRPDAYARLVERLLGSPSYGERMAVDWLDMARYADSYGFQVDREREVWPWRDWVIKAFNENMRYDEFITWQLAGDLLPDTTDEQILATAFNRLHQQESEGGSVEEEYRVEYVADRLQTFGTAFLGLTLECARCHDHKYDPITQKEYYQLAAFFQNVDEAGLYSYFTDATPTPALMLGNGQMQERRALLARKVAELERKGPALRDSRREAFAGWRKDWKREVAAKGETARFRFETLEGDKLGNDLAQDSPAVLKGGNKLAPGRDGQAVWFGGDDPVDLPLGNFRRDEAFSVSLWLKSPDVKERAVVFHRSRAWTDAGSRGYELLIEEGRLKWSLIHFWPGNAISIRAREALPVDAWTHVVVSYDGSSRAGGLKLFVDGREARVEVVKDGLTKDITGGGHDHLSLGERFRDRGFKDGLMDDFRVFGRELSALEVAFVHDGRVPEDDDRLFEYYLAALDEPWMAYLRALQEARRELATHVEGFREIMVMRELPQPKKAHVLFRGDYAQRREEVLAGTPEVLPLWPEGAPRNRLGLARWLTDSQHPLTARVTVNRFWHSVFGRGLVKTAEDFGSQGERPVHGALLDWLAASFVRSGWDVKALMRQMVMSRTYRQRSIAEERLMKDDPENVWLARGPRFRLPAEMIRDNALAAAGLLNLQAGGPPVNPYEMSEAFKPAKISGQEGLFRRSLYTNWRRTGPPPAMIAFDAPRRAVCSAKRERTDSPLQALILLNGTQYVEAARVMGEALLRDSGGDVESMAERGFLRCLSRRPDGREREIVRRLYAEQLEYFSSRVAEAQALLQTGTAPRDERLAPAEAAAATVLAQALMNHDACVVKR